jgi:peptide/nickel transport system permease protein
MSLRGDIWSPVSCFVPVLLFIGNPIRPSIFSLITLHKIFIFSRYNDNNWISSPCNPFTMTKYILQRLAIIPPALILVHFLSFAYAHIARPLRALRNPYLASVKKSTLLWPDYQAYIKQVLTLDFGVMPDPWGRLRDVPLTETILNATAASLGLLAIALVFSIVAGVLLGIQAARVESPSIASWLTSLATLGLSMPTFFVGSLFFALWFLYVLWGGPGVIPLPIGGFGWDGHLIMPALVLVARPIVQIAQITAGLLAGEYGKQYVIAARSVGNTWKTIRWRHALRNILAPIVLTIAASLRLLVGELIVVEWLFDWPGLGNLLARTLIPSGIALTRGIVERPLFLDPAVVAAVLAVFAAMFLLTDLVASVLVRAFDPRLRET